MQLPLAGLGDGQRRASLLGTGRMQDRMRWKAEIGWLASPYTREIFGCVQPSRGRVLVNTFLPQTSWPWHAKTSHLTSIHRRRRLFLLYTAYRSGVISFGAGTECHRFGLAPRGLFLKLVNNAPQYIHITRITAPGGALTTIIGLKSRWTPATIVSKLRIASGVAALPQLLPKLAHDCCSRMVLTRGRGKLAKGLTPKRGKKVQ